MMKGLMDCCPSQEMLVDHLRSKATEAELGELKAWKVIQENELALAEKLLAESEK